MRTICTTFGALVFSLGLAGLLLLGFGPRTHIQLEATRLAMRAGLITVPPSQLLSPLSPGEVQEFTQVTGLGQDLSAPGEAASASSAFASSSGLIPTRLRIARIRLDSEVVPARLVRLGGAAAVTWEVPPHRVGHAQGTAAAGARGKMVLLGHVSSINAGNVFADLDRLQVGDDLSVLADTTQLTYRVAEVRRVARDDVSVMAPSEEASLTLITCTGAWLPALMDYSHRLTVRAALSSP